MKYEIVQTIACLKYEIVQTIASIRYKIVQTIASMKYEIKLLDFIISSPSSSFFSSWIMVGIW